MFWAINDFVKLFYQTHGPFKDILDVGSRDINGSIRSILEENKLLGDSTLTGIDMIEGKNVDMVLNAHDLLKQFRPESFDLVTCCETLEHDNMFWITVKNMRRLVKPGGYLLITTPGIYFFRHDFPSDYYRFTDSVFQEIFFQGYEDVVIKNYEDAADTTGKPNMTVMGYGRKI